MRLILLTAFVIECTIVFAQVRRRAVPDFCVVQYAGSIGTFSVGAGYDILKSRIRFSAHFGMVPIGNGGPINILATKLLYSPLTLFAKKRNRINPFNFGVIGSYHYEDDLGKSWPRGHGKKYYWWNRGVRLHPVLESSVTHQFPRGYLLRSITAYCEFNSNDIYLASYLSNTRALSFLDIVKLGIGIRITI